MGAIIYSRVEDYQGEELAWIQKSRHDEGKEKEAWSELFSLCYLRGSLEMGYDDPSSIYTKEEFELLNELIRYSYPKTRAEKFMWDTIRTMREKQIAKVHIHANY